MPSRVLAAMLSLTTLSVVLAQESADPRNKRIRRVYLTVASVDRSLAFYQDLIGLEGSSEKRRLSEQISGLHGVPGLPMDTAALKLTGDSTLEFKEFIPGSDTAKARLPKREAVQFVLEVRDLASIRRKLTAQNLSYVGPEQTAARVLVRDPDGILIELREANPSSSTSTTGNLVAVRIRIFVENTEATTRFYQKLLSCTIRQQAWRAEAGADDRTSICEWPEGNPAIEFIQSRERAGNISVPRSIQDAGVVCFEVMLTDTSYDEVVKTVQTSGAEPLVPGAPTVEISGRRSVMLRGPDSVFLQFRSFRTRA
jgi:catechol 2,3-dioxygenase-like lactoylglutathione lyase family enzyme